MQRLGDLDAGFGSVGGDRVEPCGEDFHDFYVGILQGSCCGFLGFGRGCGEEQKIAGLDLNIGFFAEPDAEREGEFDAGGAAADDGDVGVLFGFPSLDAAEKIGDGFDAGFGFGAADGEG